MKKLHLLFLLTALILLACTPDEPAITIKKIGVISDVYGWEDKGISTYGKSGADYMDNLENIQVSYYESTSPEELATHIGHALRDSCELIIAMGANAEEDLLEAALQHPYTHFMLLDHEADTLPPNLRCLVFDVEQAAFPCGYLAAAYAHLTHPETPALGWIEGRSYEKATHIKQGFMAGIAYFNTKYQKTVSSHGLSLASTEDPELSARAVDSLMTQQGNLSLIFPFTGRGNAAAYAAIATHNVAAMGMEMDCWFDYPEVQNIFLSSCVKRYDLVLSDEILAYSSGNFEGGKTTHYNLRQQKVWLAGYHHYLNLVPDSITRDLNQIITDILEGTIDPLAR
ncbi:MAG: hypothetical protein CSA95_02260 [Bacteroidetes bacterium]|nr:MAG: hypothetical protein CSA95_02260 [Bacteroidota bacterium]